MTLLSHTLLLAAGLIPLLLAVLRYRRHRPPRALLAGALAASFSLIFPLATATVGIERIDAILSGGPDDDPGGQPMYFGSDVSERFINIRYLSAFIGQVGLLLIAVGFMRLLRQIIRRQAASYHHPHTP